MDPYKEEYPQFLRANDSRCLRAIEFKKLLAARESGRITQTEFDTEDKKIDDLCWKNSCPSDTNGRCGIPTYPVQSTSGQLRFFHFKGFISL